MAGKWINRVVGEWLKTCDHMTWSTEDVERARTFIDGEYANDFEYPPAFLALRAFLMHCAFAGPDKKDDEMWSSSAWRAIAGTERAYRMGWDDAMAHKQSKEEVLQ